MANIKQTEWLELVDIDKVPRLIRAMAIAICVGKGYPWWNYIPEAEACISIIKEFGGTVKYGEE
jgi:hypothetical protein